MYGTRYQKKKMPYGVFFFLFLVCLTAGYLLSGLLKLDVTVENLQDCLLYVCVHPLENWSEKTPAFLGMGFIVWFAMVNYYMNHYRDFHSDMEHGDACWLEAKQACKELKDEKEEFNRILSENLTVSLRKYLSNNNMLVIGSSGSFKTTSLLHQNLLQSRHCNVVLDVKGDTQRKFGKALQKQGKAVKSLNFKTPEKSDQYNPFAYLEREDDLIRAIKALHDACRPQKSASMADPFWDDAVDLYLQSLFYYSWLDAREKGSVGSMNTVISLCNKETNMVIDPHTGEEISELQYLMDIKEDKYGSDYPPVRDYRKLKGGATETVRSVILMINSMLSICETAEVKRIFDGNDINIRELGTGIGGDSEKPIVLFLVIPDNNNVYNWIVSMFYTQMFDILIRLSDDELHAPLPVFVEVWMDEFYAGAKPADADILLGVVRSRNIAMIPMLQSISQIKTLFKDDKWETIMDNIATVAYLGSGPLASSTHEFISKALGEATADSRDDSQRMGMHGDSTLSYKKGGIKLMSPDQVKRMPPTDCIVFLESRPPIYDTKAIPFDKPDYGYEATKYYRKRYKEALDLGEYEHPVYTVYDPVHFRYITVEREERLKIFEDKKEIETFQEAAKRNPDIYVYNIEEKDLLYLSWGHPERSKEEVEQIFKQSLELEQRRMEDIKGLAVLQDVGDIDKLLNAEWETDKSGWDKDASLRDTLAVHWEELSEPEKEEICFAMDDGLSEEQLRDLILLPLVEMEVKRRAYILQNKS